MRHERGYSLGSMLPDPIRLLERGCVRFVPPLRIFRWFDRAMSLRRNAP
jgi:hypothetical protein